MRLGIFGGTFDPVHFGHLILAEQCREQAKLDSVFFVPAARPPHKLEDELTSFDKRVEMLTLAISGNPYFRIDESENTRSGPSYTVDTIKHFRTTYSDDELFLLVGADSFVDLPSWYKPEEILEMVEIVVANRPGWEILSRDQIVSKLALSEDSRLRSRVITMPDIHIASRDIRQRIAEGRTVRYIIPRAVEAYIEDKRLYRK
ncbi:MAG: nicotinate-nucleotide adenylyltransferase [Gemmataceae bacterium]